MIRRCYAVFGAFLIVFALGVFTFKQAHANLMILPSNIVFEGKDRFAEVTLVNNGNEYKNYNLEWGYNRMLPGTGAYEHLDDIGDDFDLSKHIVVSPRRVRLGPKAKQKIRLALRRPGEIPAGDHHVHLRFIASSVEAGQDGNPDEEGSEASVKFVISYSIPVFLRVGESDVKADLGQISLERNERTGLLDVLIPVNRSPESPYSILGYFMMYHIDENGKEEFVGELSNANVFPEIDNRTFRAFITKDIEGGSLRIVMHERDKKGPEIAQKVYSLQ